MTVRWGGKRVPWWESRLRLQDMYTGTLIRDLMATVELAELRAEVQRFEEERQLREIFAMNVTGIDGDQIYQGAA
jgi:hypothetical protein